MVERGILERNMLKRKFNRRIPVGLVEPRVLARMVERQGMLERPNMVKKGGIGKIGDS